MKISSFPRRSHLLCFWLITALHVPFCFRAQQDTVKADRAQVTDFYFAAGLANFPVFNMSQQNFKEIVPKSQLMSGDLMFVDYNNYSDSAGGFNHEVDHTSSYVQAGITLRLRNREAKNAGPWLKLGVNFFSTSTVLSSGVFKVQRNRQDSLYQVNAVPVHRVTDLRRELTYVYTCQSANFEATLIYKLNAEGIFSLYGGPGAFLGVNFNGRAEMAASTKTVVTDYMANSFGNDGAVFRRTSEAGNRADETFNRGPNLSMGLFVNIGVDLRLGHRFEVVKNTHAFLEAKPMFRSYGVKGAGLQNTILLVGNVGLRYEL